MAHRIFKLPFSDLYPLYLTKVTRKGRTEDELIDVISWLTGYTTTQLTTLRKDTETVDLETFFAQAPSLHPNRTAITGLICGVRIEELTDPTMKGIRQLDKLVDELAKGRTLEKILRPNP